MNVTDVLWPVAAALGVWDCILLGVVIYAARHERFVPAAPAEVVDRTDPHRGLRSVS